MLKQKIAEAGFAKAGFAKAEFAEAKFAKAKFAKAKFVKPAKAKWVESLSQGFARINIKSLKSPRV